MYCQLLIFEIFRGADKDWDDIKFGVDNQVDFYAVSFVKDARVVHELKDYLKSTYLYILMFIAYSHLRTSMLHLMLIRNKCIFFAGCNADIHVIVKIESADSIPNLHSILSASDGVSFLLPWFNNSNKIFQYTSPLEHQ